MSVQRFLLLSDKISSWSGKASAWLICVLMLVVSVEVFKRYMLNAPTAWIFDFNSMLYGTLFMMCGAYTLSQDGHVRGDFLYSNMKPRTQAGFDLALYFLFFMPGIIALVYAGYGFAGDSWRINEHSASDELAIYYFKAIIPLAGALVLLQGIAEIVRCIVCLREGDWPKRLKDVEEIDVVGEQLANSAYLDEDSRRIAEQAQHIDETAHQRGGSEKNE